VGILEEVGMGWGEGMDLRPRKLLWACPPHLSLLAATVWQPAG
jgi:hypothetical protein